MSIRTLATKVTRLAHTSAMSGTTVFLTLDSDGIRREYDNCIFESGRVTTSPDSGEETVVFNPVASFPRSTLIVVPENGATGLLEAPLDPDLPDVLTALSLDPSKSIEGGRSLDTIILYLSQTKQS